jgi:hypothetical protein
MPNYLKTLIGEGTDALALCGWCFVVCITSPAWLPVAGVGLLCRGVKRLRFMRIEFREPARTTRQSWERVA